MHVRPSSSHHPRATAQPLSLEVAVSSAALEGRRPGSFILRGSLREHLSDERFALAQG
ncbi:hypothetical protein GA0061098_103014 [Bradyrhizobium shewense]|uniref:Uncharacterized protein n=1 Tax=Bradyrhizobium shewense TaxID=1761772 RepID=A0A1C3XRV1_9BRAD|nr:hypothetical protein GA0061098_103014 [Bradyrhizobium shewense]